jgi:hypothetical protein
MGLRCLWHLSGEVFFRIQASAQMSDILAAQCLPLAEGWLWRKKLIPCCLSEFNPIDSFHVSYIQRNKKSRECQEN